jgi:citrate lyase subunit beta/citryl-CoA lyase
MIGELDLGAQIGVGPEHASAWAPVRMQVVLASAASGLPGPIGPVSPDFTDLERVEQQSRELYRMGFRARPAIHPAQVPVYERAYRPSREEVERARRIIARYEAALAEGRGAAVDDEGHMIDEASVKVARSVIEASRAT